MEKKYYKINAKHYIYSLKLGISRKNSIENIIFGIKVSKKRRN